MKRIINRNNLEELEKLYMHDAMFPGYTYDYPNRSLSFRCENIVYEKEFSFEKEFLFLFKNVVYYEMVSCHFWGESGERINCLVPSGQSPIFQKLSQLQKEEDEISKKACEEHGISYHPSLRKSYWNRGTEYFQVEFEFFTGDRLIIIAEELELEENDLQDTI